MRRDIGFGISRLGALVLLLGLLVASAASPALAQSLDDLRASGAIGERYDGYAVVRDSGAAGASRVVNDVNAKRRGIYEQRAASQGVTAEDVGRVYAGQIMQKAPRGTWFLDENGNWRQK